MQTRRTITILIEDDPDLRATLDAFQSVQQALSPVCFHDGQPLCARELHEAAYYNVKDRVNSQMTCSAIRLVAGAYRSAKSNDRPAHKPFTFARKTALFLIGSVGRDASFLADGSLSIWTVAGRKRLNYTIPAFFRDRFDQALEFDSLTVVERKGRLYGHLAVTLSIPDPKGDQPVGIDRGEINAVTAVDSRDQVFFGSGLKYKRRNRQTGKQRRRLQERLACRKAQGKDTHSVRRALKRLSCKQSNRSKDFCRVSAKRLIDFLPAGSILVMEDLNIPRPLRTKRNRNGEVVQKGNCRGRSLRRRLSRWTFRRMQGAIVNTAEIMGIPVAYVDAAYTSQICSHCGQRGVRKRHLFVCPSGEFMIHADINAPTNIRNRYQAMLQATAVGCKSITPEARLRGQGCLFAGTS